jgi:hypothetical protein
VYEIIFGLAGWSSWITSVGVSGIVALFIGICSHISSQFDIVGLRLAALMMDKSDGNNIFFEVIMLYKLCCNDDL